MGVNRRLVIFLSVIAFVHCDFSLPLIAAPTPILKKPTGESTAEKTSTLAPLPNDSGKPKFNFQNFYQGSYSPLQFSPTDFFKFYYRPQFSQPPLRPYLSPSHITSFQGISPPFSNIIPPVFGGNNPSFPINPSQIFPPTITPPSFPSPPYNPPVSSFPSISNFGYYSLDLGNFPLSLHSLPISALPKDSPQLSESIPNSCGPPAAAPPEEAPTSVEPPAQAPENNASFDQQPVSFPYEPAAPDAPEQQPFTPAQEYGPPKNRL